MAILLQANFKTPYQAARLTAEGIRKDENSFFSGYGHEEMSIWG